MAQESVEVRVDNTRLFADSLNDAIERALEACGVDVQKAAYENAPYKTGLLKTTITHVLSSDEKAVYIGSNLHYAPYQELGVSGGYKGAHGGRGYLRPALSDNKTRIRQIFEAALKN